MAAGAGLNTVMLPAARAISSPRCAAATGCSSWVTKTRLVRIASAAASTSAGLTIRRPRPRTTMMALSPRVSWT